MTGLREVHRREKWARIRDAARRLFSERGFEATTVRDIAREADVATGTVLLYGATKSALLHEVWREGAMPLLDAALAAPWGGRSLAEDVDHVLGPLLAHYGEDVGLSRVIVRELAWLEGPEREAHAPLLSRLIEGLVVAVRRAGSRGELRADLDPQIAVQMLMGVYQLVLLQLLSPLMPVPHSVDQARASLRRLVAELVSGFAPRRSS